MNLFLRLLFAFLRPQVDGDPEPDPADPAPSPAPDPDPQPELEFDADNPEPEPKNDPPPADKEELEAERRARTSERERADRYERELTEIRARQSRPVQDEESAREDAVLQNPNATPLEKWQVQANRELRAGRSAAQQALAQAQDVRDQTSFSQLSVTEPAMYKRYSVRVEQELTNARKQGWNPNREAIYNQLIAKDMREGKFKRKAAADPVAPKKDTVRRGALPGARSDVSAKGGSLSNRDRLAKKLDGVAI